MRSLVHLALPFALVLPLVALAPSCDADLVAGCKGGVCGGTGGIEELGGAGGTGGVAAGGAGAGGAPVCHPPPGTPDDVGATGLYPCDVLGVLQVKCHGCHQSPPLNGAPFPLLTYDDSHVEYSAGKAIWRQMCCAIDKSCGDCVVKMPFGMAPQLTGAELQTLLAWCDAGAPSAAPGTVCP